MQPHGMAGLHQNSRRTPPQPSTRCSFRTCTAALSSSNAAQSLSGKLYCTLQLLQCHELEPSSCPGYRMCASPTPLHSPCGTPMHSLHGHARHINYSLSLLEHTCCSSLFLTSTRTYCCGCSCNNLAASLAVMTGTCNTQTHHAFQQLTP
jgi:hypothetical protein